jgi:hypothetical protein
MATPITSRAVFATSEDRTIPGLGQLLSQGATGGALAWFLAVFLQISYVPNYNVLFIFVLPILLATGALYCVNPRHVPKYKWVSMVFRRCVSRSLGRFFLNSNTGFVFILLIHWRGTQVLPD